MSGLWSLIEYLSESSQICSFAHLNYDLPGVLSNTTPILPLHFVVSHKCYFGLLDARQRGSKRAVLSGVSAGEVRSAGQTLGRLKTSILLKKRLIK